MNVLVSNISILHDGKPFSYEIKGLDCSVARVEASETNESILRCVVSLNEVRKSGGLNNIIALVSNTVLYKEVDYLGGKTTAFGYFTKCAANFGINEKDIIKVPIENADKSQRSINLILNDICENISSDDTVYIDGAGGLRTINNVIQLLTKILKYAGIKNPSTLYADVQNRPNCFISDTKNFDKMTDLADAFNEFMTSGKSEQLRKCLSDVTNENILKLVNLMCEFSDKIRLGNIDDIEATVKKLNEAATVVESEKDSSNMESVIIRRFIPVIKKKLIGETEKPDYCRLVKWCLENSLIQQAVTIFVEKIPVYLFDRKILTLNNKDLFANYEEERRKNKMLPIHWQTNALYSHILSETSNQNPFVAELINCLEYNKASKNAKIQKVIDAVKKINPPIKYGRNEVEKFCMESGFTTKSALINGLVNNKKKCLELLGITVKKEKDQDKFPAVERIIKSGNFKTTDFSCNISISQIVNLLYGYLYVKNIRNRINHASDAEMFSISQKAKLKDYDFAAFDLETIKKNISTALDAITNCGKIIVKQ